jgi:hypothetical protein
MSEVFRKIAKSDRNDENAAELNEVLVFIFFFGGIHFFAKFHLLLWSVCIGWCFGIVGFAI